LAAAAPRGRSARIAAGVELGDRTRTVAHVCAQLGRAEDLDVGAQAEELHRGVRE
jgi:hypothetical protein